MCLHSCVHSVVFDGWHVLLLHGRGCINGKIERRGASRFRRRWLVVVESDRSQEDDEHAYTTCSCQSALEDR